MSTLVRVRPSLAELSRRAQKPDHRRVGNWLARRIARPAALRVTWAVLPWGVTAHHATLAAWCCGLAAAAALGCGTLGGWLSAALLLHLWYLLDHVDGQLARFRGTASLDGVQLDYLMHHSLRLLLPLGCGYGLLRAMGQEIWLLAGLLWGLGLLMQGLTNDAMYKAFVQRLKRVRGTLEVTCTALAASQEPAQGGWRTGLRLGWLARKLCEDHMQLCGITLAAGGMWLAADEQLAAARGWAACMAVLAPLVAAIVLARSLNRQQVEQQFAAWYRPPAGHSLRFHDGWWYVEPDEPAPAMPAERSS